MFEEHNLTSYLSNFITTQVVSVTCMFPLNPFLYLIITSFFAHVLFPKNFHSLFLLPTLPHRFPLYAIPPRISPILLTISSSFFLSTRPNHLNKFSLIFRTRFVTPKFPHIYLFLILSYHLVTPDIHLNVFISAALVIISSLWVWYSQYSDPYIMVSLTIVF